MNINKFRITAFIIILLAPAALYSGIEPMPTPARLSKSESARVFRYMTAINNDVTEKNFAVNMKSKVEPWYEGFLEKIKLKNGGEPVEVLFYSFHGKCVACHNASIAIIKKDGDSGDTLSVPHAYGEIKASIIKYDEKGDSLLVFQADNWHAGGISSECLIVGVNSEMGFEKVFSDSIGMVDIYGSDRDVKISVTTTASKDKGYDDIVVRELRTPHKASPYAGELEKEYPAPVPLDRTIIISTKTWKVISDSP